MNWKKKQETKEKASTRQLMVYVMTPGHRLGYPSDYYYNTIREGYETAGFDPTVLEQAVDYTEQLMEQLLTHLAERLQTVSGKKQYGYLKADLKNVVDEIVDELAQDSRIAEAYRLWWEVRGRIESIYTETPSDPPPLSRCEDFKPIRNRVIQEALNLGSGTMTFEEPASVETALPDADPDDDAHSVEPVLDNTPAEPEEDFEPPPEPSFRSREKSPTSWHGALFHQAGNQKHLQAHSLSAGAVAEGRKPPRCFGARHHSRQHRGKKQGHGVGGYRRRPLSHGSLNCLMQQSALLGICRFIIYLLAISSAENQTARFQLAQMMRNGRTCHIHHAEENMHSRYPAFNGSYIEQDYDLLYDGKQVGYLTVGYYGPYALNDAELNLINSLNRVLLLLGIALAGIAGFLVLLLSRYFTRPISDVVGATAKIARGEYGQIIRTQPKTQELASLVNSVNEMSETLKLRDEQKRRMTADIAHEIFHK